jgi:hypothetical protein
MAAIFHVTRLPTAIARPWLPDPCCWARRTGRSGQQTPRSRPSEQPPLRGCARGSRQTSPVSSDPPRICPLTFHMAIDI